MSYPAPAPQPGWYPDPSGGPGPRYFDGHQWTISAPPPSIIINNNFGAPTPVVATSGPNTALIAAVAVFGGLYLVELATTDFRVFVGLVAVATLGYLGYRAYERAVDRRTEDAAIASRVEAQNRAFMSGDSFGLYGQYPPAHPPDPLQ